MGDETTLRHLLEQMKSKLFPADETSLDSASLNELRTEFEEFISEWQSYTDNYLDFREISNSLYDGIHVSDGEGRVLFINQAYTRTTGIRPEEILGRKVKDIEASNALYRGSVTERVLETRDRVNSVAKIIRLDKEVLVTGTPMFDKQGNIRFVVTNTRDFSELKRLELDLIHLTEASKKANEELTFLRLQQAGGKTLLFHNDAMRRVMDLITTVATADVTVLITGESGTGKELVANEIYQSGNRREKPFIKVNCAAIPGELLESELFGYEAGAFTDAKKTGKAGMFELADTGVILLDEIGDMPMALQAKLLRVLQQREIMRIGGSKYIKLDIRVMASTNKDLREEILRGRFREDLFYRLNVVPIELMPLRERKEDLPYLADEFCRNFNKKYGKNVLLRSDAKEALATYSWPGNIRELENLIERLVVTNASGYISQTEVLYALYPQHDSIVEISAENHSNLKEQVNRFEREIILRYVEKHGSLRKAAVALGVDHSTLVKKCKAYALRFGQPQTTQADDR